MKKKSFIRDLLEVIITVAVLSFVLLEFIILPCLVNGQSMYPTLNDGDHGYSFKITKTLGIKRFDICVIEIDNDENDKLIVKRVIGMPNETVEYKNNELYIDGIHYDEPYLNNVDTNDLKVTLSDNEYFCLGDNRPVSKDSRFYGPFNVDDIVSTKLFIIYPFSNFGVKK